MIELVEKGVLYRRKDTAPHSGRGYWEAQRHYRRGDGTKGHYWLPCTMPQNEALDIIAASGTVQEALFDDV